MTNLLDIPPELFQQITHELVSAVGVNKAWRLRQVCRTFAAEIEHDIFAKQPKDAFLGPNMWFLKNKISRFIMKRLNSPGDANKELPRKINSMVDFLAGEIGFTNNQERMNYTKKLIDGLKKVWMPSAWELARNMLCTGLGPCNCWSFHEEMTPELTINDKLWAAITVRAYTVIKALLPIVKFSRSYPAGFLQCRPLETAIRERDKALFEVVLEFLNSLNLKANYEKFQHHLWVCLFSDSDPLFGLGIATDLVIKRKDAETSKVLLDFYAENIPKPDRKWYKSWILGAISGGNGEMISLVMDFSPRGKQIVTARQALPIAFKLEESSAIETTLDHLPSGINDGTICTLPIFMAVRSGNILAVQAVLDHGADVDVAVKSNIPSLADDLVTPLEVSIHRKDLKIIRCLVEKGATIPHIRK